MSDSLKTYTYRGGKKVELEKSPEEMVVRALPAELSDPAIRSSEQVSSASSRVITRGSELEDLMSRSRGSAPTHHAYYEADSGSEFLITDRIFVRFREAPADEELDAFAGRYGLVKTATYSDRDYLFQLTDHTGMNPVKLVVLLTEEDDRVEAAEHDLNQRMNKYQFSTPTDPAYAQQWHLHTNVQDPQFDTRSCARCEDAWRLLDGFGSRDVVVAVSDDGCRLDHRDFDSADKFASWGYLRGSRLVVSSDIDSNPDQMYKPGSNHGTACCGVIAGEADAVLTVGAAANCRLLPIQWESDGPSLFISDSKLLTVINYLSDKADIMSNSWGNTPRSTWALPVVNRIEELAVTGGRRGNGIVFLWAAGNENCPIDHVSNQDIPYTHGWRVQGGAAFWEGPRTARLFSNNLSGLAGVMHIAALASTARRSHYSNYGSGIDLCAPSSNSHAYYRLTTPGLGITTATGESSEVRPDFGGTSSATPLVAGVAALVVSANPALSAAQVIAVLKGTAAKDLDFNGYQRTPPASYDPNTDWDVSPVAPFDNGAFSEIGSPQGSWSPWFGHGRVDAQAAVARALGLAESHEGEAFAGSSSPDRSIPDNNVRGIKDKIVNNSNFTVASVAVRVDVTHTYIGDLVVSLIAPSGKSVRLHDRAGGSANDLHRDYDATSLPSLLQLKGEPAAGEWTLQVQDLAAADRGRLRHWSLDIGGKSSQVVIVEDSPGLIIPDNSTAGIERTVSVAEAGQLSELEVDLDLTHTWVGDLTVELRSPAGTRVLLHNRLGGAADNIIRTYSSADTAALQPLRGEDMTGDWRLRVSDHASADQGKLNRWSLKFYPLA
jgi:subtilisin-like proprotein convertase family protein